jgi:protein gp37
MFRDKKRYGQNPDVVVRSADGTFRKPLTWARNPEKYPIKRVFTCSWSDFFIEEADPWREDAWDVIRQTPQLTYQILTKRPERMEQCLPKDFCNFDNVWLGVTAETQRRLHERAEQFYPASYSRVAFVSIEPMLEAMYLSPYMGWIDWVIVGCESGPGSRETNIDWVRSIRDQCVAANTPFFLKQLMIDGKLVSTPELDGQKWTQFPNVQNRSV